MSRLTLSRPIATLAVQLSISNAGVQETGENRGKAVEAYQSSCVPPLPPGSPWCAAVVRFRYKQAATQLATTYDKTFPRTGWTPDYSAWAKRTGTWITKKSLDVVGTDTYKAVMPGDLVCFYMKSLGRIAHIGLVTNVYSWGVITMEGNTSPEPSDELSVERDGDGYYRKERTWAELGEWGGIVQVDF
jgi:hypothetical protein